MNFWYFGVFFSVKGMVFILFFFLFVLFGILVKYFFKGGFLVKVVFLLVNDVVDGVFNECNVNGREEDNVEVSYFLLNVIVSC